MSCRAVPFAQQEPLLEAAAFLKDVRRNLIAVRYTQGVHSSAYLRLVRHYRLVSTTLQCRREFERLLHPLPAQYVRVRRTSADPSLPG
jgi:hypothetical protein